MVVGEALLDMASAAEEGLYLGRPGGSPLNVAVGLARLGQATAFAGRLSDDPLGSVLRAHLRQSGADLRYLIEAAQPSTIALVELSAGQASYRFSLRGADFQWTQPELAFMPAGARAVHFGSLASWLPPGDAAIAAAMNRIRAAGSALISYDPNVRPALQRDVAAARRQIEASVRVAHVVKASTEDLAYLYRGQESELVARNWLSLGAELVVITAGSDGATGFTRGQSPISRPAYPAQVSDTVGAGDAFTSGLLDGLARRDLLMPAGLGEALQAQVLAMILDDASVVAGLTCSRPGANPPWLREVQAMRKSDFHEQARR